MKGVGGLSLQKGLAGGSGVQMWPSVALSRAVPQLGCPPLQLGDQAAGAIPGAAVGPLLSGECSRPASCLRAFAVIRDYAQSGLILLSAWDVWREASWRPCSCQGTGVGTSAGSPESFRTLGSGWDSKAFRLAPGELGSPLGGSTAPQLGVSAPLDRRIPNTRLEIRAVTTNPSVYLTLSLYTNFHF